MFQRSTLVVSHASKHLATRIETETQNADNDIGDEGAQAIGQMLLVNSTLTKLDMSGQNGSITRTNGEGVNASFWQQKSAAQTT